MRRHQVIRRLVPALAALWLGGCSQSKDNTELVVTVWSDLKIPTEMDTVRIRVMGKEQTIDHPFQLSADGRPGTYRIPVQLALVPAGAKDLSITIHAIGSLQGTDIVSQRAVLPFIDGQAHELPLFLAKSCRNVSCDGSPGLTCDNGACARPVAVNTAALPAYVSGQTPSMPDASTGSVVETGGAIGTGGVVGAGGAIGTGGAIGAGGKDGGFVDAGRGGGGAAGAGGAGGTGGKPLGTGGSAGAGGTLVDPNNGDATTFDVGKASGVLNGWGWVSLGGQDTLTSPTCGTNNAPITPSSPCQTTTNWSASDALCLSGRIPAVIDSQWNDNWGVQIGVNVTEPGGGTLGKPYSTITLFTRGTVSPTNTDLRAEVHLAGDSDATTYCARMSSGTPVAFASFNTNCWDGSGVSLRSSDVPKIDKIGLQISSDDRNTYTFSDFCLTRVVLGPAQGGNTPGPGVVKVGAALLDFGIVDLGSTSAAQTVAVTVSGAPVALSPTVVGAGFAITGTTCAASQPIGSCTISVKFAPSVIGAAAGTLTIGAATIALSGTGAMQGTFSATDRVDLGTILVNQPQQFAVQIVPTPSVSGLTCVSSGASLTAASQTCPTTGPVSTPCTFTYMFKSATAGAKSDSVVCSAGGKVTSTTVVATVVTGPALAIAPSTGALTATIGDSGTVTLTVANTGGSLSGLLTAVITGSKDFSIVANDCMVPLASLAVCKIQVAFKPTALGTTTAMLTVSDAGGSTTPASATLTGVAVATASVSSSPSALDFGAVQIGTTKSTTVTLRNTGGTATGQLSVATAAPEFVIASDLCSAVALAPNGTCTVTVKFVPASPGAKSTVLKVSDTSGVLGSTVLTGTAASPSALARRTSR
jgi:hypothetical protein